MGKAKKRNFYNLSKSGAAVNLNAPSISREDAIKEVIRKIDNNDFSDATKDIISLFGINAEELAEAGAAYEDLVALKAVLKLSDSKPIR